MTTRKTLALVLMLVMVGLSIGATNSGVQSIDRLGSHLRIDGLGQIRFEPRAGKGVTFGSGTIDFTGSTVTGFVFDRRLSTTAAVNMNTATATTLYTCPAASTCIITKVVVRNASTSLTTASYSFGWNSATFNDVVANAVHTELTGATLYTSLPAKAGSAAGAAAGTFKVLMNTLQGGAATTTIDVFGYVF